jgi:hypothetical protein
MSVVCVADPEMTDRSFVGVAIVPSDRIHRSMIELLAIFIDICLHIVVVCACVTNRTVIKKWRR